jgi:hypothetical protein
VAVWLSVATWELVFDRVLMLVTVDVLAPLWLPVPVCEPVPKGVTVLLGVLVAVSVWLPVLDWLSVAVGKSASEGAAVVVSVDVSALVLPCAAESGPVDGFGLASISMAPSTATPITVSGLVGESVLGIGALPVSACAAASGIVTEGASASPVTPASWLVAEGASPSPRNSPDAPICDSRRHAGPTNINRARSPLVEPT